MYPRINFLSSVSAAVRLIKLPRFDLKAGIRDYFVRASQQVAAC